MRDNYFWFFKYKIGSVLCIEFYIVISGADMPRVMAAPEETSSWGGMVVCLPVFPFSFSLVY